MRSRQITYEGSPVDFKENDTVILPILGFRLVPNLTGITGDPTAQDAYNPLQVTYSMQSQFGVVGENGTSSGGSRVIAVDGPGWYATPAGGSFQLTGGLVGQTYTLWIAETMGDLENPAQSYWPGMNSGGGGGGGGGNPISVATTIEANQSAAAGTAPTLITDGASLSGAVSVQVSIKAVTGGATINAVGTLEFYVWDADNLVWARAPQLDQPLSAQEGGDAALIFNFTNVWVPEGRIAARGNGITLSAGTLIDITYQVGSQNNGVTVGAPTTEVGIAVPNGAAPTLAGDGASVVDAAGVRVRCVTGGGNFQGAGTMLAYLYVGASWVRCPDYDQPVTANGVTSFWMWDLEIEVPTGRIAFRPSGVTLSAGATISIIYEVSTVSGTSASTVIETGLAPNSPAPSSVTDGASLTNVTAYRITLTPNAGTIDAAGKLKAYIFVGTSWVRCPDCDLTPREAGDSALVWGDLAVLVPAGRIAYRPYNMSISGGGTTFSVRYDLALV